MDKRREEIHGRGPGQRKSLEEGAGNACEVRKQGVFKCGNGFWGLLNCISSGFSSLLLLFWRSTASLFEKLLLLVSTAAIFN